METRGRNPKVAREVLVALYHEGLSLRQIGEKVGLHYTTVLTALDKAGVERRPKTRRYHIGPTCEDMRLNRNGTREHRLRVMETRRAEWVDLYRAGYALMDIGEMYGKHHTVVLIELRKAGEPRRSHGGGRKAGEPRRNRTPKMHPQGFVNYASYRMQYRKKKRIERMLEMAALRRTRLCA